MNTSVAYGDSVCQTPKPDDIPDDPQPLDTAAFLHWLFDGIPEGFVEVTCRAPDDSNLYPRIFTLWAELPLAIHDPNFTRLHELNRQGYGISFAPAVRSVRRDPEQRTDDAGKVYTYRPRGRETDALYITTLWADVDDHSDSALDCLNRIAALPSLIIDSGGGYHLYWLLDTPLKITNENRKLVKQTLKGLSIALGSDHAVADLARIMRLPGTVNTKPNRGGAVCHVIDSIPGFYSYSALEIAFAPLAAPREPRVLRHIPTELAQGLPAWVGDYIRTGAPVGQRNLMLFKAAARYAANGIAQHQAEAELGGRARSDGLSEGEIKATITSAYRNPESPNIDKTSHLKMAAADHILALRNRVLGGQK